MSILRHTIASLNQGLNAQLCNEVKPIHCAGRGLAFAVKHSFHGHGEVCFESIKLKNNNWGLTYDFKQL